MFQILPQIFKFLSTNERKIVKLVCKSWFEACNVFSLLNDELITCLGIYQLSDTYELLNRSQRRFLFLEFEHVEFNNDSSFWENNGYKIRSICFANCNFLNGTLGKIIIYCVSLMHLSFRFTCSASESPINENDLDEILKIGIVRENLNSLEIYVHDPDRIKLSNYITHQLFSIFPKVKILKIKCTDSSEPEDDEYPGNVDLDLSEFCNKNCFTFSPVLNYLRAATDRIEKLELHFPCRRFPMNVLHPIFTAMKR